MGGSWGAGFCWPAVGACARAAGGGGKLLSVVSHQHICDMC
jgi:hypothetical protein